MPSCFRKGRGSVWIFQSFCVKQNLILWGILLEGVPMYRSVFWCYCVYTTFCAKNKLMMCFCVDLYVGLLNASIFTPVVVLVFSLVPLCVQVRRVDEGELILVMEWFVSWYFGIHAVPCVCLWVYVCVKSNQSKLSHVTSRQVMFKLSQVKSSKQAFKLYYFII